MYEFHYVLRYFMLFQYNFKVLIMITSCKTNDEISLNFNSMYLNSCLTLYSYLWHNNLYLAIWGWPEVKAETCRQINKPTKTSCVVTYIKKLFLLVCVRVCVCVCVCIYVYIYTYIYIYIYTYIYIYMLWVAYATHSTLKPVPNLPR